MTPRLAGRILISPESVTVVPREIDDNAYAKF